MGSEERPGLLYTVVRSAIAYDDALPPAAVRVYIAVGALGAWREWALCSASALAQALGYAPSTVYAALASLVKRGYLAMRHIGRRALYLMC